MTAGICLFCGAPNVPIHEPEKDETLRDELFGELYESYWEKNQVISGICPYCGGPLPSHVRPDGQHVKMLEGWQAMPPCNQNVTYHATPENRWEWFGEDKPKETPQ